MLARNNTPFATLAFEQAHRDGERMGVIVVRATYNLSQSGELSLAEDQALVLADEYAGKPHETQLLRVGDLVPFKPAADITVLADSYPMGQTEAASWECGIRIGSLKHVLRCHGPRHWSPPQRHGQSPATWQLSAPQPVASIPLDYAHAAGGPVIGDPERGESEFNPLGTGILHPDHSPTVPLAAPLIDSEVVPATDPFAEIEPQGMGPIAPFWRFRQQYAGTYDDEWLKARHPQLPADFDYRFYQAAHPGLIYPGYLRGNETVAFAGLTPGGDPRRFSLPSIQPYAMFEWMDDRRATARLNLDGLHLDLRAGPPWRVDLTWRGWIVICPAFFKIDLFFAELDDPNLADMPVSGEEGLVEARDERPGVVSAADPAIASTLSDEALR